MSKRSVIFFLLAVIALIPSRSHARATSANANIFFPAMYSPYLSVDQSLTLQQWRWQAGIFMHEAKNPLEARLSGTQPFGVIDHLLIGDLFGVVGLTDWWQAGLSVPVVFYEEFNDIATKTSSKSLQMSDVRFEMKFNLLDPFLNKIGISVSPYVLFPTGSGERFVGNNSFAGGLEAIVDGRIGDRLRMALNLGYRARDGVIVLNTEQDDQFTYGLGANLKTWRWLEAIGEVYGNTSHFFSNAAESPIEFLAGLRFFPKDPERFSITPFGGVGLTSGLGSPDIRVGVSITYSPVSSTSVVGK